MSESGNLFSFGHNGFGQLGHGNVCAYNYPKQIEDFSDIDLVDCGNSHVICKKKDGKSYGWGYNSFSQLGLESRRTLYSPSKLRNWPNDIVDIKCGCYFTIVFTSNQEVFSCGDNRYGQLGRFYSDVITKVDTLSGITHIECGENHTLCVDNGNKLIVFGNNEHGQLGLDDTDDRYSPEIHPTLSNIIDISSGGWSTFVKTLNNEIYYFGDNRKSLSGIKTSQSKVTKPKRVFFDNEDIWYSIIRKSKAKSARK